MSDLEFFLSGELRAPHQHAHLASDTLLGDDYFQYQQPMHQHQLQHRHLPLKHDSDLMYMDDVDLQEQHQHQQQQDDGDEEQQQQQQQRALSPLSSDPHMFSLGPLYPQQQQQQAYHHQQHYPVLQKRIKQQPVTPPMSTSSASSPGDDGSVSPAYISGSDSPGSLRHHLQQQQQAHQQQQQQQQHPATAVLTLPASVTGGVPQQILLTATAATNLAATMAAWPISGAWMSPLGSAPPPPAAAAAAAAPAAGKKVPAWRNRPTVSSSTPPMVDLPMSSALGSSAITTTSTASAAAKAAKAPRKEPKKSAHNVIERRYRNNINTKIAELRSVVPSLNAPESTEKLNKGKILRRATDYVRLLTFVNQHIQTENVALRETLRSIGHEHLLPEILTAEHAMAAVSGQPNGDFADSGDEDEDDDDDEPAAKPASKKAKTARRSLSAATAATTGGLHRIGESGRLLLMVCMGISILWSPWPYLSHSVSEVTFQLPGMGGRSLLSVVDPAASVSSFSVVGGDLLWMLVRAVCAIACLVAVFLVDPTPANDSAEFIKAENKLKQAETEEIDGRSRRQLLEDALTILGHPVGNALGPFDSVAALGWQIFRQVVLKKKFFLFLNKK